MLIIAFTMVFASGLSVQAETDASDRNGSGESVIKGFDINLFGTEESKSIASEDIQNLYRVGNRTFLMDILGTLRSIGNKCLDVSGSSKRNGARVTMYRCHGGPNQQWRLTNAGELRGIGNKCLDVDASRNSNGTRIQMWDCTGGPNQKWRIVNGGLRGWGNRCLDVNGSRTSNGAKVSLYQCHGGANQKWRFVGKKRPVRRNNKSRTGRHAPPSSAYKLCAREGQQCRYSGNGRVAYGVNGRFKYKNVARSIKCDNATFGDPVPGYPKRCYVRTSGRVRKNGSTVTNRPTRRNNTGRTTVTRGVPKGYRFCSNEGRRCNTGTKALTSVAFGANGRFKYRSVRGAVACTSRIFGDPAPRVRKKCYVFIRKVSQRRKPVRRTRTQPRQNNSSRRTNNCRPNAYQIAVFYDAGYRGRCSIRGIGSYRSSGAIGLPNDSISSIIIGSKVFAVLCKDNNFRGTCQRFRTTDSNLGNNSVGNDSVSSMRVIAKNTSRSRASRTPQVTRSRGSRGSQSRRVINGRNVGIVNYSGGTFTKSSTGKKWLEYKKGKRGVHAAFTETGRDEWSVYLRKSDGARIQLDLHTKLISINGRKLYTIVNFY